MESLRFLHGFRENPRLLKYDAVQISTYVPTLERLYIHRPTNLRGIISKKTLNNKNSNFHLTDTA